MDEKTQKDPQGKRGEPTKKVDEGWKDTVKKEKRSREGDADHAHAHEVKANFPLFISGLMMEGLISLGEMEHPVSKKKSTSLPHAQFIIDTLAMLQEKTKNNLSKEEAGMLDSVIYDLRMRFVTQSGQAEKK